MRDSCALVGIRHGVKRIADAAKLLIRGDLNKLFCAQAERVKHFRDFGAGIESGVEGYCQLLQAALKRALRDVRQLRSVLKFRE